MNYIERMTRIVPVARILLGLVFLVFSLNYFALRLHGAGFLPAQPPPPPAAMAFGGALMTSGYMTFIKVIELGSAIALLADRYTTLALALLAPVIVGIAIFHFALAPSGAPVAILLLALEGFLAWAYRAAYRPMLQAQPAR